MTTRKTNYRWMVEDGKNDMTHYYKGIEGVRLVVAACNKVTAKKLLHPDDDLPRCPLCKLFKEMRKE